MTLLAYPHRWVLTQYAGSCYCHFRRISISLDGWTHEELDPYFGPPEGWCPEDADDIEATLQAYDVFSEILAGGHRLDIVDTWNATGAEEVRNLEVSLAGVPRDHFRFFENFRFEMRP